jgi:hypothetical protein
METRIVKPGMPNPSKTVSSTLADMEFHVPVARKAVTAATAFALLSTSLVGVAVSASPAAAGPVVPQACPAEGPNPWYTFADIHRSSRPTNLYSAYITGPGTISYNEQRSATVSASASASVTAEANVVFAKASTTLGVSVSAGRTWTDGFNYSLTVASGQRRRMRLFQEARTFVVTKKTWNSGQCRYQTAYQNQAANAPRTTRHDEWKLES